MSRLLKHLLKHKAVTVEANGKLTPTPTRHAPKQTTAVFSGRQLLLADHDGVTTFCADDYQERSA